MKKVFFIVAIAVFCSMLNAQISEGGMPFSFQDSTITPFTKVPFFNMPSFNVDSMLKEDSLQIGHAVPFRFAKAFDVNLSIKNSGLWNTLKNGDKIWRLGIQSKGAYAINVLFSDFELQDSAKVFIFNYKKSRVIGAFTSKNNSNSKILSTIPVSTDKIIIEYYEPKGDSIKGKLKIGSVGHDYVGVTLDCWDPPVGGTCYGLSLSCEVDINCPNGVNFQDQKHAVCRIFFKMQNGDGFALCSGALINNTKQDATPYFLTANHCVCNNSVAQTVVTVFNYENVTCNEGNPTLLNQSVSGATWLASAYGLNYPKASDFSLLKLDSVPPCYDPYFLGWDHSGTTPVEGICIHHPRGDVKKISTAFNLSNAAINAYDTTGHCDVNTNKDTWNLSWYTGACEPGSSGAPLLDGYSRVIGQCYAGVSGCNNETCFGRFSTSWTGGGTSSTELSAWLDPGNTGAITLNGNYIYYITGPTMDCKYVYYGYTLNNVPSNYKIKWTYSSNLYFIGTSNNVIVLEATGSGAGWVQATVTGGCGPFTTAKYNLWVGVPAMMNSIVTYPQLQSVPGTLCAGDYYNLEALPTGGVTAYNWSITPNDGNSYDAPFGTENEYTNIEFYNPSSTIYTITVSGTNSCGTTPTPFSVYTQSIQCSGGNIVLTPNPASSSVTVTINPASNDSTQSTIASNSYVVKIINNSGTLFYTNTETSNPITIPVGNLSNGLYIVQVTNGINVYSQQLSVNH
jgi:hypothetical protein